MCVWGGRGGGGHALVKFADVLNGWSLGRQITVAAGHCFISIVKGDWIRKYKGNFISCKKFKIFWDHDIFIDENIFVNSSLVSISENILTQMHSIS